jgi:hypothetical protein
MIKKLPGDVTTYVGKVRIPYLSLEGVNTPRMSAPQLVI